ncbi:DUF4007 family protein [Nostoc parmelioides]|uniref:DUF4007 family protein n=1 Tax=Nostoc parmelioides FACHB-3921 TaxID=2692909 RepID=A0ABR8BR71_9NOSO|nr:DUF4007 family protein [Nostoc parmelioides]MBD2255311.1 DUF4007 family protein [Nostoc parmelioides FACHB-3921]
MVKQISLNLDGIVKEITNVNPAFARHETFHPRYGWIKKGFDMAQVNPKIFLQEDAPVRLGVGKNMVSAIRYWCNAFKVLENDEPSEFGNVLLGEDGWDIFLEDPATLWLLHWNLLKPSCNAAAWYFTFNIFRENEFSQDDLFNALCTYRDSIAPRIAESSLKKDVSCILRMYVEQATTKVGITEESLDCPFTQLGIIHTAADSRHFTFRVGYKGNLPAEILVAACLEYASFVGREQRTISISRLVYDIGSPGMIFKLSESAVCDAIEQVARWSTSISLSDSSGLIQFSFTSKPEALAKDILDKYYKHRVS